MYPSTNNSFTSSTIQPRTFSSFYDCNDINISQAPREHYFPPSSSPFQVLSPHCVTMEDGTILSGLLHESSSSDDDRHQKTNTILHEQDPPHDIWASVQSTLGKCSNNNEKVVTKDKDGDAENSTTQKTSKKDRHSKINTAQGPRDRRMRLSLEVAKKFFMLQDMLGFDKASKTVEWLLMKSTSDIQELLPQQLIQRSLNCEVMSGDIDDECMVKSSSSSNHKEKKKSARGVRKSAYLLRPLAKETREKARARARERTMVKSNRLACGRDRDQLSKLRPSLDPNLNLLDSCTFNGSKQPSANVQLKQGNIDNNSSSMTHNWRSSLFNYRHSGVPPHEHQFNDFQILGNLWETNN
ncbi:hypothetical protein L2E82_46725 [Cichorium intybus]|uniref:Uncharacterized protein n=1 Tax=Cichorium intybus TaxID=13427 RepID=A0ACB8YTK0_CICIN|nr:hypothetical protein L2E82_46725 [Cichorium intybus]